MSATPSFGPALSRLSLLEDAPEAARRMAAAGEVTGLGPMAAVAGTLAQLGVEAAMAAGIDEAIVENGGDIYIHAQEPVTIGLYAGDNAIAGQAGPEDSAPIGFPWRSVPLPQKWGIPRVLAAATWRR